MAWPKSILKTGILKFETPDPGDGERKTLLTRQIAFEPLPASALFTLLFMAVLQEVDHAGSSRD